MDTCKIKGKYVKKNGYISLSPQQEVSKKEVKTKRVKPPPPPIIVDAIKDFNKIHEEIVNTNAFFQIKIINNENININADDEGSYNAISNLMYEKDYSFCSYENKQDRAIKL